MAAFPGALAVFAGFTATHTLAVDNHAGQHNLEQAEILAVQTKVGIGSSTPSADTVLTAPGLGTSSWAQVNLTTMVSGVLPVVNGGTGTTSTTGTGSLVFSTGPTISGAQLTGSPTLTTPTVASFVNSQHTHANAAAGGQLTGSVALVNSTVTANLLATGAMSAIINTDETTASTSYVDLATPGPSVTVNIGVNGLALISITSGLYNSGSNDTLASIVLSGANISSAATNEHDAARTNTTTGNKGVSVWLMTGLNPGSTTFALQYRAAAGTGHAFDRRLSVVPL